MQPETYCDARNLRILGISCCMPWSPSHNFPIFTLYPAKSSQHYTIDWRQELPKEIYDQIIDTEIYYVIHGYTEPKYYAGNRWLIPAVKTLNVSDKSSIIVDWTSGSGPNYAQAIANLRTVGHVVGYSLLKWNILDKANLVGHSLGSQVVHEAGKYTQEVKNVKPKYCLGLDPAAPGFSGTCCNDIRLNVDSCELVNIIHTSAEVYPNNLGILEQQAGILYKSGNCDWYINCGHMQPNCKEYSENEILSVLGFHKRPEGDLILPTDPLIFCSHHVSMGVWLTSMKICKFIGHPCPDCAISGQTKCSYDIKQATPFLKCNKSQNMNYYVPTTSFPYC